MLIDQGKHVILVLMDMSVAFDTVDDNENLSRFRSYLEQCSQKVYVHGILSDIQVFVSGVSEGSVHCPLIFTMYTRPLGIIAQRYGVKYQ